MQLLARCVLQLLVTWFEWTLSRRFLFIVLRWSLDRLKRECHWLRAVSWQLCGQCKPCPGRVDPETKKCYWHQATDCPHDDCAHYVPVTSSPFCCAYAKGPDFRISQTWMQVLRQTKKLLDNNVHVTVYWWCTLSNWFPYALPIIASVKEFPGVTWMQVLRQTKKLLDNNVHVTVYWWCTLSNWFPYALPIIASVKEFPGVKFLN